MIRMFKLTSDLGIAPGRGRWPIVPEIIEEVTVVMAKSAGRNVNTSLIKVISALPFKI